MKSETKIIGILLAKNEEFFVERAVQNALAFCDEFILVDNESTDRTFEILAGIQKTYPDKVHLHKYRKPGVSHDLIAGFAGTKTWIFGVDGDEIYDPIGLSRMRERVIGGEFDGSWCVFGNVLNVKSLESQSCRATGHLAPPCRSMTKLYNFAAIEAWDGPCQERLHGGTIRFREGYHAGLRYNFHEENEWEASDFRCLHLCFLKRSSVDLEGRIRQNIMDRHSWHWEKIRDKFLAFLSGKKAPNWKEQKYARGPLVEKTVDAFSL